MNTELIDSDFYYMCMKDNKVLYNSIGTWLRAYGFHPTSKHIEIYFNKIKQYSNINNDYINLDEFYYFVSLNHNDIFNNIS